MLYLMDSLASAAPEQPELVGEINREETDSTSGRSFHDWLNRSCDSHQPLEAEPVEEQHPSSTLLRDQEFDPDQCFELAEFWMIESGETDEDWQHCPLTGLLSSAVAESVEPQQHAWSDAEAQPVADSLPTESKSQHPHDPLPPETDTAIAPRVRPLTESVQPAPAQDQVPETSVAEPVPDYPSNSDMDTAPAVPVPVSPLVPAAEPVALATDGTDVMHAESEEAPVLRAFGVDVAVAMAAAQERPQEPADAAAEIEQVTQQAALGVVGAETLGRKPDATVDVQRDVVTEGDDRVELTSVPPVEPAGESHAETARDHESSDPSMSQSFPQSPERVVAMDPAQVVHPGTVDSSAGVSAEPMAVAPAESAPVLRGMVPANLVEQLDRVVLQAIRGDDRTMQIELEPLSLGKVQIHCRTTAEGLAVEIRVENQSIRSLLAGNETDLRAALDAQGVQLGRFSVSCRDGGNQSDQQRSSVWDHEGEDDTPVRSQQPQEEIEVTRSVPVYRSGAQHWVA